MWRSITGEYELAEHELVLLREACRTVDALDELDGLVRAEGVVVDGRAHPALTDGRQQRITLARLLAALRMPEEGARPQRRQTRGVYRLRGVG